MPLNTNQPHHYMRIYCILAGRNNIKNIYYKKEHISGSNNNNHNSKKIVKTIIKNEHSK